MKFFHTHDFEILSKDILVSGYEQSADRMKSIDRTSLQFFQKKIIYIMKCSLCGKIKEIVESNT